MTEKTLEVQKQETNLVEEPVEKQASFIPNASIYETEGEIVIVADMPGVDKKSVDITLEKNRLTITGHVELEKPEGFSLAYAEYEVGDYQRSFILSDEIDRNKIEAKVKDGVLRLHLAKAAEYKARKIAVKAG